MTRRTRVRRDVENDPRTFLVPRRCLPLAEALISDQDVLGVAAVVAVEYAEEVEDLGTCLDDMDRTALAVNGEPAPPGLVRAASLAWVDRLQRNYNCLTCEDPLTGMHTIHHLQSCLTELYRFSEREHSMMDHALVVVELFPAPEPTERELSLAVFEQALRMAAAAEVIRAMLPEEAQPGSLSDRRVAVVVSRGPALPESLVALRDALDRRLGLSPSRGRCTVWMEALPDSLDSARLLVDDLAR